MFRESRENLPRNQRISGKDLIKIISNIGEDKRSCYENLKLIRNAYSKKLFTAYPKHVKINRIAKSVEAFSQA